MQLALLAGSGVFYIGVLVPILSMLWLAIVLGVVTVAGTALVHTGGLEPNTFRTSMVVALGTAVPMLVAAWREQAHLASAGLAPRLWSDRHPVWRRAAWLVAIAALTTLAAAPQSPYFPYPVATMAVLTATIFLIVAGASAAMTLMNASASGLYRFGATRAYAAGFLTAAMLLVGAGGVWAHLEGVTYEPWRMVRAETELAKVAGPRGAFDAGLKALCLGAGETEPTLARSREAAPACRFLPGATGGNNADDDCFTSLMPLVPEVRRTLRRDFRLNAYDADDVAMAALLTTCTATEVFNRRSYFFQVARNQAKKDVMSRRRDASCAVLDDVRVAAELGCTLLDPPELRERKLAWLWDKVLCELDEHTARIVRSRLVDDLSFREAGKLWGMTEEKARNTFHNAVKKVRRLRLADCFRG